MTPTEPRPPQPAGHHDDEHLYDQAELDNEAPSADAEADLQSPGLDRRRQVPQPRTPSGRPVESR